MFEMTKEGRRVLENRIVSPTLAKRLKTLLACAVLSLCVVLVTTAAGDETLVVPNGFEYLEGNSWITNPMTDPGDPGFRQQILISHLQFKSIYEPIWISGWDFRPDAQVLTPRQFTYYDADVWLSTTTKTPSSMSSLFANNTGDDETLVFSGDMMLSTSGGSGLKDFDYTTELQTPFCYDPNEGNLLIDFKCKGGFSGSPTNSPVLDGQWLQNYSHFCNVIADNPGDTYGTLDGDWVGILKFTYRPICYPELKGDLNGDCVVDFFDIAQIASEWLESNYSPAM